MADHLEQLAKEIEKLKKIPLPVDPSAHLAELVGRLNVAESRLNDIPTDPKKIVAELVPHWPASRLQFFRDANGDGIYTTPDGERVTIPRQPYTGAGEVIEQIRRPGEPFQIGVKGLEVRPTK